MAATAIAIAGREPDRTDHAITVAGLYKHSDTRQATSPRTARPSAWACSVPASAAGFDSSANARA